MQIAASHDDIPSPKRRNVIVCLQLDLASMRAVQNKIFILRSVNLYNAKINFALPCLGELQLRQRFPSASPNHVLRIQPPQPATTHHGAH